MSTGTDDTQPNGAALKQVHGRMRGIEERFDKRLGQLEQEIVGSPGTPGMKADLAIVRHHVERLLAGQETLAAHVNARNAVPVWFYPALAVFIGIASVGWFVWAAGHAGVL